ncbi:MAG TPA: ankyrin repeat domain-containing protein [Vicinamibacteria bacterium]|nr:ankyrin repeat domain-containing protein [Vicinamibacteria bacterium]
MPLPAHGVLLAVAAVLGSVAGAEVASSDRAEALFAAARAGDTASISRLLGEGVDVNARGRYDTTALFFAADKGQLAVVDLLLARGADVAVRDTFYGATALSWAVDRGHAEIARRLVEKGAPEPEQALELAVKMSDGALARAVIARGPLAAPERARALAAARDANATAIVELLSRAEIRPEPEVPVSPDRLARMVGTYAGDGTAAIDVELREGVLLARAATGESWRLIPVGEDAFRSADAPEVWVRFEGRADIIEWAGVQQGAQLTYFRRAGAADAAPSAASEPRRLPEDVPARTEAAPWPSFRGRNAGGIADGQGAPSTWDLATGANVLWKTEIPGFGNSSPIVWGDRVYLTTAVGAKADATFRTGLYGDVDPVPEEGRHSWRLLCLDRRSGRVLFERTVHEGAPRTKRHTKSTHANPTPATDGRHLVAMLGSEGLFAFDMDGRLLWKKDLGVLDSGWFYDPTYQWGFSSSPIIYGNSVIAQVDMQKGSYVGAWDLASGRELWRTPREEISTWGTPTIVSGPKGDELVTNGTTIRAYDPKTGAPLWTIGPNSEITVATPVAHDGIVYVTAGYPPVQPVYAVRAGARGKLDLPSDQASSADVAWSVAKGGTYIPTPIVYRGHLYTLHNNGRLLCYDARTGAVVYGKRVGSGGTFTSSPVAADGRLYIATEEGDVFVVRAGSEFEVVATNAVGEPVMATPAISDGVLLVRTLRHLYGFGAPAGRPR